MWCMRTFWWGCGTGVSSTGSFHAQAMYDTALYLGGRVSTIFGTESQSFMDNSTGPWTSSGKLFIRSMMEKSFIGRVIITAQLNSYHLSVETGRGLVVSGVQFDAPAELPSNGSAVKESGVDGLTISDCVFYANMADLATIHAAALIFPIAARSSLSEINFLVRRWTRQDQIRVRQPSTVRAPTR